MLKTTLIVLLVLGVLTAGAVAWAKHNGCRSIENRMQHISERIAHRLDLNDDQRVRLDDLVETLRELRNEQEDSPQGCRCKYTCWEGRTGPQVVPCRHSIRGGLHRASYRMEPRSRSDVVTKGLLCVRIGVMSPLFLHHRVSNWPNMVNWQSF